MAGLTLWINAFKNLTRNDKNAHVQPAPNAASCAVSVAELYLESVDHTTATTLPSAPNPQPKRFPPAMERGNRNHWFGSTYSALPPAVMAHGAETRKNQRTQDPTSSYNDLEAFLGAIDKEIFKDRR